jgi:hypothetical protein
MTRYLRIGGLCFSLAVIVSLLGFTSAFAESNHNSTRSNTSHPNKIVAPSDGEVQPNPKPVEATTVNSSKSNSSERQIQPNPEPVEATTVNSSKSNSSE